MTSTSAFAQAQEQVSPEQLKHNCDSGNQMACNALKGLNGCGIDVLVVEYAILSKPPFVF
jgi:hypothetical protein